MSELKTFTYIRSKDKSGFSLVELMVAVAIVAILAAVSMPAYQDYIRKGYRSKAQQFMLNIASAEERYLMDARAYTATVGAGGLGLTSPSELSSRYSFAVTVGTAPANYSITATASGTQLNDGNLTLSSDGTKIPLSKWQ